MRTHYLGEGEAFEHPQESAQTLYDTVTNQTQGKPEIVAALPNF